MSTTFSELLKAKNVLLADGATGTNLFAMGLQSGDAPEPWNIDLPERVLALHQSFIDAGSDWILTNSFGGNAYRLKLHNLQDQVFELNKAAAELARKAASTVDRDVLVVGSMGPTGEIMAPLGTLSAEDCEAAFRAQAEGLKAGGADVLCFETISAPEELIPGVKGAKSVGLPVCATMSFDTAGRTMMGLTPADFVKLAEELGLDGLGANCGVGASDLIASLINMQSTDSKIPVIAKANCGIPEFIDGKIVYSGTQDLMQEYAKMAIDSGASIIGGCCGTTADHVAAMRAGIDMHSKSDTPNVLRIEEVLGEMSEGSRNIASGQMALPASRRARRKFAA